MRLAVVVVPSRRGVAATTRRASPLADLLADRLSEADAAFRVEVLEARGRLADRLASLLAEAGPGPVLVFLSGDARVNDEGAAELILSGGGALPFADVRAALSAATDQALLVVDVAVLEGADDPTAAAALVGAIRDAVDPRESGIGLLIGARAHGGDGPSAFVRSFLAGLDRAAALLVKQPSVGGTALYDAMKADGDLFHRIAATGWFRGKSEVTLLSQPSIVIGGSDSSSPSGRQSTRPSHRTSGAPSIPPSVAASPAEQAWKLGSAAAREGRHLEAVEHYKRALLLVGAKPERADLYFRIGLAKQALGSAAEAIHNYDKALSIEPLHHDAFERVRGLLRDQKDFATLERLYRRRFEARGDPDARRRELGEIARMWLEEARDPARAIAPLEQCLGLSEQREPLEQLVRALDELGRHAAANEARKRLARLLEDPSLRARVLAEAASVAQRHLPGGGDAIELGKAALEADPTALEALEVAAGQLGTRRRWRELAELYQSLLERVVDSHVIWDIGKKLGMLLRDELDEAEGAKAAFARASEANPEDLELYFWLAELWEAERAYPEAAREMRRAAAVSDRPDVFRRALWCFEKTSEPDSAWNAACVLDQLGEADINESLLADTHRPDGLIAARGQLDERDWDKLRPPDPELDALLAVLAPTAIRVRIDELRARGQLPKLDESTLQNPAGTTTLVRSLAWTSRLLGVPAPALHVIGTLDAELTPLPFAEPTAAAGRSIASGLELSELAFLWGRVLAYLRSADRWVVFYPTATDLARLLLAAHAIAGGPKDGADEDALARALERALPEDRRDALSECVAQLEKRGLRPRVERYVRRVHAAAGRAGLLACGDVARAVDLSRRYPLRGEISADAQRIDLRAFAISREYAALRERVGVAVKA